MPAHEDYACGDGLSASPARRDYVRFVALGDAVTCDMTDREHDGASRGWARVLADAIAEEHGVSFCNLAAVGSTSADVLSQQVPVAVAHRAHFAALVVGLTDTMRATWNPQALRANLFASAESLTADDAVLLTVRFHEHSRIARLPGPLARLMAGRIEELNEILDEVHRRYGGRRVDLAGVPGIYEQAFWSFDRMHPSARGHQALAGHFAALLHQQGLTFPDPSPQPVERPEPAGSMRSGISDVLPWVSGRARELAPSLLQSAVRTARVLFNQSAG